MLKAKKPKLTYVSEVRGAAKKAMVHSIEILSGRRKMEQIYADAWQGVDRRVVFWGAALERLQIRLDYEPQRLAALPAEGPLLFVANHPFGVIDGLALCHIASQLRSDFRILISAALYHEDRLAHCMLPIDFSESEQAIQTNIQSKRQAVATLRNGGALVIFPAGGISTALGPFGQVTDLEWKLFAAKLVHLTKATVVPVFFHGQNSRLFQVVSQFSLTLRLSLIVHEVHRQRARALRVSIGDPLTYETLASFKSRQQLTDHLRRVVYALGAQCDVSSYISPPPSRIGAFAY